MFYPVFLELSGKPVLVVGGGLVAERKVNSLLEAGARVTVVSPEATDRLAEIAANNAIVWTRRQFQESDLEGVVLVISATDNPEAQTRIAAAARARKIMVNTVDQPALCDFIVPAVVKRGDVIAAITTSGKSPALAAALRAKLEEVLSEDVGRAATLLGAIRSEVHQRVTEPADRKRIFERILESGLMDWIGECDDAEALKRVREMIDQFV